MCEIKEENGKKQLENKEKTKKMVENHSKILKKTFCTPHILKHTNNFEKKKYKKYKWKHTFLYENMPIVHERLDSKVSNLLNKCLKTNRESV